MNYIDFKKLSDRYGVIPVLAAFNAPMKISLPVYESFLSQNVDQLSLSVRSSNALKSGKIVTIRDLVELIQENGGLSKLRNIGKKSISEIQTVLFYEAYQRLTDNGKEQFWNDFLLKYTK